MFPYRLLSRLLPIGATSMFRLPLVTTYVHYQPTCTPVHHLFESLCCYHWDNLEDAPNQTYRPEIPKTPQLQSSWELRTLKLWKMALNLFPNLSCFTINYGVGIRVNLSMQNNIFVHNFMNHKSMKYHHLESQTALFYYNFLKHFLHHTTFQISKIYNSKSKFKSKIRWFTVNPQGFLQLRRCKHLSHIINEEIQKEELTIHTTSLPESSEA